MPGSPSTVVPLIGMGPLLYRIVPLSDSGTSLIELGPSLIASKLDRSEALGLWQWLERVHKVHQDLRRWQAISLAQGLGHVYRACV